MSLVSQFFGGTSTRKIPLDLLVVSGGGGSGGFAADPRTVTTYNGCGGGGGGAIVANQYFIGPGTVCPVTVGSGGAAGSVVAPATLNAGGQGGTSSFQDPTGQTFTIIGGGGSGCGATTGSPYFPSPGKNATSGATGGGLTRYSEPTNPFGQTYGNATEGQYFSRLAAAASPQTVLYTVNQSEPLGFGGASYGGYPAHYVGQPSVTSTSGGAGSHGPGGPWANIFPTGYINPASMVGNGIFSRITGITTMFGSAGLNGSPQSSGPIVQANTGHGGVGTYGVTPATPTFAPSGSPANGFAGSSGIVVVSYPTAFAASPSFPGATDISPQTPGRYTYRFTSPGSITLP